MKWFVYGAKRFLKSEDGPTAVEYAVMMALIAILCITGGSLLSGAVNGQLTDAATDVGGL